MQARVDIGNRDMSLSLKPKDDDIKDMLEEWQIV